ncbi:hypothetical protein EDB86DRAFT_351273 [Lactarius hatsudake]|nr:hypothetical protein EDB86DRAFT_351273 [Lactarius hatsudake]
MPLYAEADPTSIHDHRIACRNGRAPPPQFPFEVRWVTNNHGGGWGFFLPQRTSRGLMPAHTQRARQATSGSTRARRVNISGPSRIASDTGTPRHEKLELGDASRSYRMGSSPRVAFVYATMISQTCLPPPLYRDVMQRALTREDEDRFHLSFFQVVRVVPPSSLVANVRPRSLPSFLLFAWRLRTLPVHALYPGANIGGFIRHHGHFRVFAWYFFPRTLSVPLSRAPKGRHYD